jgi:DNA-binding MarR family transcriptional regulator
MYMLRAKYCNSLLQQVRIDGTDLHIIRLLARDSRTPYKSIATEVGITSPAAKERIDKMISRPCTLVKNKVSGKDVPYIPFIQSR